MNNARSFFQSRALLASALAIGIVAVGTTAWYALKRDDARPVVAQECRASVPVAERLTPLARGEVAAVTVAKSPKTPPEISFQGADGRSMSLADFKGKIVLVNLWATWCVPCREEMPALDKLQAELGGPNFQVAAINVDTRNPDKPKTWLQENGIRNLAYYADPTGNLLQVLQRSGHVVGLPTTLLVDATGCEIALLKGPAEWASADALALVRAALGRS
jgi:thiol-disulfide isomerase/thioredoxin